MNIEARMMAYDIMKDIYEKGIVTDEIWFKYCEKTLEELMEENKEVLDRLKNM